MRTETFLKYAEQWVGQFGGYLAENDGGLLYVAPSCGWELEGYRSVTYDYWRIQGRRGKDYTYFMYPDKAIAFAMLVRHEQLLPDGQVLTWERHKPTRWCFWIGPKKRVFNVPNRIVPYCVDWAFNGMPAEMLADKLLDILP